METFPFYLRSEGRELGSRLGIGRPGGIRTLCVHGALIAVFGVMMPWSKGLDFLDPVMITAYACLGVLFAGPASAQAFAGGGALPPARMLARILIAAAYGEGMALAVLLAGVATVDATHRRLLLPPLDTLAMGFTLGLSASLAQASVAAWAALRFSAVWARAIPRAILLVLLGVFFFRSRWLPDVAGEGAAICLAVTAAAWFALRGLAEPES